MNIEERFVKIDNEIEEGGLPLGLRNIANKRSQNEFMHVVKMLDELFPSSKDVISAAEHDQIWFRYTEEELKILTDTQIKELVMCGVFWNCSGLSVFV